MPSLCVCATQWHTNVTRMRSRDCIKLRCAPHFDMSPLTYPPQHRPTRQGASPPPHSHPQIWQHETAANKPGTSCGVFSASSLPTSSTALTRYTGAHTWERACQLPSSTAGGRAFVQSCACMVGFVTRHGSRPGRQRVKDDDGGDEFGVCGVQPVPRPIVCTAPSRATAPLPPSTRRRRHHLRATPAAPMCHRRSHHWLLPLRAAPPLSVAFVHAPCAARAPRGAHCHHTRLAHVHTSHTGPHATPLCPPCLGPVPGPIRSRALRLGPHRVCPRLPGPIRGRAPHLGPHRMRPHLPGPIRGCAPCLSPCRVRPRLLGPICSHATRSCDRVRVAFVCHWVAHTRRESMGDCTYTLDTVYEHV